MSRAAVSFKPSLDYFQKDILGVDRPAPPVDATRPFWFQGPPILSLDNINIDIGKPADAARYNALSTGDKSRCKVTRGGMWPHQKAWWNLPTFVKALIGGYGCISGDTKILDPISGKESTAEALCKAGKPVRVLSIMPGGSVKPHWASPPFVKGKAPLYKVTLSDGKSVTVTKAHKFLTPQGWQSFSSLGVGHLLLSSAYRPESNSGTCRLAPLSNALHSSKKAEGCSGDYPPDLYSYDEQPPRALGSGLFSFPLQRGARKYSRFSLRGGAPASVLKYSRAYQKHVPLSMPHSLHASCLNGECQKGALFSEPLPLGFSAFSQYLQWSFGQRRIRLDACGLGVAAVARVGEFVYHSQLTNYEFGMWQPDILFLYQQDAFLVNKDYKYRPPLKSWQSLAYKNSNRWLRISKVEYVGEGKFYDLTVPGPANYLAQGIWHHNSGKTFIGAKRVIGGALTNSGCITAAVSPTFPLARKTMVPTIKGLLAGKQTILGPAFWWKFKESTHEFFIRYKGRDGLIQVMSGEDPESLRGPNIGSAWLDEPFLMGVAVLEQMFARIRHPEAPLQELLLTGTPESLGWGYDLLMGEMKAQHEESGTTIGMVQASSRLNLATGASYIKRLEGTFTDRAAEAYIEGAFVNLAAGQVYYGFQSMGADSNVQALDIPHGAALGAGMDFNVNPMAATVFWRAGSHIHFFDEIELANADTELMCAELRERYVDNGPRKRVPAGMYLRDVYPDPSGHSRKTSAPGGKTDFHFIEAAGFTVQAPHSHYPVKDTLNAFNGKLRPKSGSPTVTISPKCKKLIRYMLTYTHEQMNKPEQKKMSHLLDSARYGVSHLFPVVRETVGEYQLSGF